MAEEWKANASSDPEEVEFCVAAARLGLDPFDVSEVESERIVRVSESLQECLLEEFFSVVELPDLENQSRFVGETLDRIGRLDSDLLVDLKGRIPERTTVDEPWRQGYAIASQVRELLGLGGTLLRTDADLAKALGTHVARMKEATINGTKSPGYFDAIVGFNSRGGSGFYVSKSHEVARRYTLSRCLCEVVLSTGNAPSLISRSNSERQKRNRAFAAEFLAPADLLKERIRSRVVPVDLVEQLALEFGVSEFVIRHQFVNHGIADRIAE